MCQRSNGADQRRLLRRRVGKELVIGVFDAQNDSGSVKLHSKGGQTSTAEQVRIETNEWPGELRGN